MQPADCCHEPALSMGKQARHINFQRQFQLNYSTSVLQPALHHSLSTSHACPSMTRLYPVSGTAYQGALIALQRLQHEQHNRLTMAITMPAPCDDIQCLLTEPSVHYTCLPSHDLPTIILWWHQPHNSSSTSGLSISGYITHKNVITGTLRRACRNPTSKATCTRPCLRKNKTQYAASCAMFAAGYNADLPQCTMHGHLKTLCSSKTTHG